MGESCCDTEVDLEKKEEGGKPEKKKGKKVGTQTMWGDPEVRRFVMMIKLSVILNGVWMDSI